MIPLCLLRRAALTLMLVAICPALITLPARADDFLTSGEDVAIAFFKTAKSNPDFDLWAKKSKKYKTVAPAFSAEFLAEEKQRILRKWKKYDERESFIELKLPVTVTLNRKIIDDKGNEEYWMHITMPDSEMVYFPYQFQDYKFAVIPQKIETLSLQPLQKAQFELMIAEFEEKNIGTAHLYMQLSPVKAYMDQPYEIDGTEQWALVTNVAGLALKSKRTDAALWNYTAPWYLSPVKQDLENLYQDTDNNDGIAPPSIP